MTLQDALKVNGKVVKKEKPGFVFRNLFGNLVDQSNYAHNFKILELLCDDDWLPAEQPCKHEPNDADHTLFQCEFVRTTFALEYLAKCKHCGAKIKAEKWEAV